MLNVLKSMENEQVVNKCFDFIFSNMLNKCVFHLSNNKKNNRVGIRCDSVWNLMMKYARAFQYFNLNGQPPTRAHIAIYTR